MINNVFFILCIVLLASKVVFCIAVEDGSTLKQKIVNFVWVGVDVLVVLLLLIARYV